MATSIEAFSNDTFGTLRTTLDTDGAAGFLATDVCAALDLHNPTVTVERLDEGEKAKLNLAWRILVVVATFARTQATVSLLQRP